MIIQSILNERSINYSVLPQPQHKTNITNTKLIWFIILFITYNVIDFNLYIWLSLYNIIQCE
jgi:hypothetical protein